MDGKVKTVRPSRTHHLKMLIFKTNRLIAVKLNYLVEDHLDQLDIHQSWTCQDGFEFLAWLAGVNYGFEVPPNWNHQTTWFNSIIHYFENGLKTYFLTHLCFWMSLIPPFWYPSLSAALSLHNFLISSRARLVMLLGKSIASIPFKIML